MGSEKLGASLLKLSILLIAFNKIDATIEQQEWMQEEGRSSNVSPVKLETCKNNQEGNYRCVRIEDCHSKRRRGNRHFCGWEGKPSHICCLQQRRPLVEAVHSVIRLKRDCDQVEVQNKNFERKNHADRSRHNLRKWQRNFKNYFNDVRRSSGTVDDDENVTQCGVLEEEEEEEEEERVLATAIGGVPVQTAVTSPWMVAIGQSISRNKIDWYCGGVLLSETIVLTAAHCITKRTATKVRVGELDLNSNLDSAEPQELDIKFTTVHPNHKSPAYYNDIAIVKLKSHVTYTKYVRPICLPTEKRRRYENTRATLMGWGNLEYNGDRSPVLQEVQVTVLNNAECNARYAEIIRKSNANTLPRGIVETQLCAGDRNGGRDACQGDSGGPLIVQEGRKRIVIGIVSSGIGCGSKIYPGIYTRVSHYMDWIQDSLKNNSDDYDF